MKKYVASRAILPNNLTAGYDIADLCYTGHKFTWCGARLQCAGSMGHSVLMTRVREVTWHFRC